MLTRIRENQLPSPQASALAKVSTQRLLSFLDKQTKPTVSIQLEGGNEPLVLPIEAFEQFVALLSEMGEGNGVNFSSLHTELTLSQTAEFLNVSERYVKELIEKGELTANGDGVFCRLKTENVIKYDEEITQKRREVLKELAALSQEMGLYD